MKFGIGFARPKTSLLVKNHWFGKPKLKIVQIGPVYLWVRKK